MAEVANGFQNICSGVGGEVHGSEGRAKVGAKRCGLQLFTSARINLHIFTSLNLKCASMNSPQILRKSVRASLSR